MACYSTVQYSTYSTVEYLGGLVMMYCTGCVDPQLQEQIFGTVTIQERQHLIVKHSALSMASSSSRE
jgi:hypothetical protein